MATSTAGYKAGYKGVPLHLGAACCPQQAHGAGTGLAAAPLVLAAAGHLAAGGDKDQDWLEGGVGLDGGVGRLVHGGHTGAVELAGVPLDVALQGHGPHTGLEVEQPLQ